ncbi:ankyrin repeat domain-containing protein [Devosia sp.]|uniref:ankyrin repeat domain-containing protein n=1 Tax=Devosia sp. TaxID=1871048 RepID=UPI0035B21F57
MRVVLVVVLLGLAGPARADFDGLLAAARLNDRAMLLDLLEAGDDPNPPSYHDGYAPLQFAAESGDAVAVAALLRAGARTEYRDHNGDRALLWATRRGNAEVIRLLLEAGSPPDSADDPYGRTPLMQAAFAGGAEAVGLLLAAGADPHAVDHTGMTALHYAAWGGSAEAAERLVAAGADAGALTSILFETPLHFAVRFGETDLVALLLAARVEPDARDSDGNMPLLLAAMSRQQANVGVLLAGGAEPDAADDQGVTALMVAARDGEVGIVRLLLEGGADRMRRDEAGRTPLDYAREPVGEAAPPLEQALDSSRAAALVVEASADELARLAAARAEIVTLLGGG